MKVAMLHWGFPPIIGGVESHLAMLGPELVRFGCKVSLLTGSVNGKEEEYVWKDVKIKRSRLFDLNSLNPALLKQHAKDINQTIINFLKEEKPDLIHVHNMHYFSLEHADALAKAKRQMGIPAVLTAHNVWDDSLWKEFNQRAYYWDMVIAVSRYIKDELVKSGYRSDRVTVIHHGIDPRVFDPDTQKEESKKKFPGFEGRRVIFHPARMSFAKGSHIALEALAIIKKHFPDVLLVMAGTEKTVDWGSKQNQEITRIKEMIGKLGLEHHVHIEFFPWEKMPLAYQAAEICIYPSCFEEPFGLVMLEAMAMKRPIVVSRAGGMPEVVKEGETGFIVPMRDPEALARRCCELLANPLLGRQMGEQGRKTVIELYTKEVMTARTLHVYGETLAMQLREISPYEKKFIA